MLFLKCSETTILTQNRKYATIYLSKAFQSIQLRNSQYTLNDHSNPRTSQRVYDHLFKYAYPSRRLAHLSQVEPVYAVPCTGKQPTEIPTCRQLNSTQTYAFRKTNEKAVRYLLSFFLYEEHRQSLLIWKQSSAYCVQLKRCYLLINSV